MVRQKAYWKLFFLQIKITILYEMFHSSVPLIGFQFSINRFSWSFIFIEIKKLTGADFPRIIWTYLNWSLPSLQLAETNYLRCWHCILIWSLLAFTSRYICCLFLQAHGLLHSICQPPDQLVTSTQSTTLLYPMAQNPWLPTSK